MLKIDISYLEAVEYLERNTYLTREDAKVLLKGCFQIQMNLVKGNQSFRKGDVREVMEEVRGDNSLYYHELKMPLKTLNKLVKSVNSEVPHLD